LKRDIKLKLTVPEYYRKMGDETLTLANEWTDEYRKHVRDEYYKYALKVEKEEIEALKRYKKKSFSKRNK
jgi:hypothetical protein